jgi:hypothetical protein
MARNFRCWVIVAGSEPTAFRSRQAEDLVPTLKQLQRTQPDVAMKWFERGQLWSSPEEAAAAWHARRGARGPRDRGPDWRPGGDHRDPRARYDIPRDQKRARFKKRLIAARARGDQSDGSPSSDRRSDRPAGAAANRRFNRPGSRPPRPSPPTSDKPRGAHPPQGRGRPPKRRGGK